jgi:hypothetical protein
MSPSAAGSLYSVVALSRISYREELQMTMQALVTSVTLCRVCAAGAARLQGQQAPPDALGAARAGFAITAALKKALDGCSPVYGNANSHIDRLFANIAHANLHYGNLVTYMRMLGLTPPSS